MELSEQVTSIELSKKLKELGVKQISLFYHVERLTGYHSETEWKLLINTQSTIDEIGKYSAFTASELLELLPNGNSVYKDSEQKYISCNLFSIESDCFDDLNPCNSLAKMLIYMIENKLIEI